MAEELHHADDGYGDGEEEEEFEIEDVADDKPMRILGRLFLGSIDAARNDEALVAANIGASLGLLGVDDERVEDERVVRRCRVEMEDALDERLFQRLPALLAALEALLADTEKRDCNILVHCMAGRSRSPALVVAWLVAAHKYSLSDAIDHVLMIRPWVAINASFRRDLELFSTVVHHTPVSGAPSLLSSSLQAFKLPRVDFGSSLVADILSHRKTATMRLLSDVEDDKNSDLRDVHTHSTVVATTAATQQDQQRSAFALLRVDRVDSSVSLAQMDDATLHKSGFTSLPQVLSVLQIFYPHVTEDTPLLVLHFTCLGGHSA